MKGLREFFPSYQAFQYTMRTFTVPNGIWMAYSMFKDPFRYVITLIDPPCSRSSEEPKFILRCTSTTYLIQHGFHELV